MATKAHERRRPEGISDEAQKLLQQAERLLADDLYSRDRQTTLDAFTRIGKEITQAESCAVFLKPKEDSAKLVLEATFTDKYGYNYQWGVTLQITEAPRAGLSGFLATQKRCVRLHGEALLAHPPVTGHPPDHLMPEKCYSVLTAPITDKSNELLGYLKCETKKDADGRHASAEGFSATDENCLIYLASLLCEALERHSEFEVFRHQLIMPGQEGPTPPELLSSALEAAHRALGPDCGIAFVGDKTTETLCCVATIGCQSAKLPHRDFRYHVSDKDIVTRVYRENAPYFTPEAKSDPTANRWGLERFEISGPLLAVPIRYSELVLGVMVLWSRKAAPPAAKQETEALALANLAGIGLAHFAKDRDALAMQHSLIQSLQAGVFRKDTDHRFTYCNHFFLESFGKTLDQVIGTTDYQHYPEDLAKKYQEDDQQVMRSGRVKVDVEEHPDATGVRRLVHVVKQPLRAADGSVGGVQGVFLRVGTDYFKRLESAEKIAQLGSWDYDLYTNRLKCSEEIWRIFDLTRTTEPSWNETFLKRVHPEDYQRVKATLDSVKLQTRDFEEDFRIVRSDGSERKIKAKAQVQFDEAESAVAVYGTFQDVTDLRRVETELQDSLDQLRRLQEEQLRTYQDLTHQIKGPVSQALMRAEMAVDSLAGSQHRQSVLPVRGLCRKVKRVAVSLRILSDLGQRKPIALKADSLEYDRLVKMLIETAADTELTIEEYRKIRFSVERASFRIASAQRVVVDFDLLEQVVNNLFDNAAKYSYPNSVVRICGGLTSSGRYHITVANKGLRLDGREARLCVQRGWRSEMAMITRGEGSGIGLYVADEIMKAMGGELLVVPTQPDGLTEFKLIFPLRG